MFLVLSFSIEQPLLFFIFYKRIASDRKMVVSTELESCERLAVAYVEGFSQNLLLVTE
jgi:hypothetical protein